MTKTNCNSVSKVRLPPLNKVLTILWVILILPTNSTGASQKSKKGIQSSQEQNTALETKIAHAVIWHLHWSQGQTTNQIRKQFTEFGTMDYALCRHDNNMSVYVDDLRWRISLTLIGKEYYFFDIEDYTDCSRGDIAEAKRSYIEAFKREPKITRKGALTLRAEHLSVLAFEKPGRPQFVTMTNTLITHLRSSETLNRLKEQMIVNNLYGPLKVHVGGFTRESPWVYYRIEGLPYIGAMLVDPSNGQFIHDDLRYIHENPHEAVLNNILRAIDKTGTSFSISVGVSPK